MADKIRFHLDENMDPDVATGLHRYGIDVTTTAEAGLGGCDDASQLTYARAHKRVLITGDTDFLRIAQSTTGHPGIIFCQRSRYSLGDVIRFVVLVHEVFDATEIAGRVEYL